MPYIRHLCVFFLLISVSALSDTSKETILIKKSSLEKDIITLDGEIDGNSVQLMCFVSRGNCREIPEGAYSFIRVAPGQGIYNDCPNIDIHTKNPSNKQIELVSEYCLLN